VIGHPIILAATRLKDLAIGMATRKSSSLFQSSDINTFIGGERLIIEICITPVNTRKRETSGIADMYKQLLYSLNELGFRISV
jgi:hypothetical protein